MAELQCGNCGQPVAGHCRIHLIPCCPGKCPGPRTVDDYAHDLHVAYGLLKVALHNACPGPHTFRQHRDRRPPWCEACRRTRDGHLIPEASDG